MSAAQTWREPAPVLRLLAPPLNVAPEPPDLAERWRLLVPHRDALLRIARARTMNEQDAEDCVQEALLRAALHEGLDPHRVGAFLGSTVVRLCVDLHRSRERAGRLRPRLAGTWLSDGGPEEQVCDMAEGNWLRGRCGTLSERERSVLLARAAGLSLPDAACHLQLTYKATATALARARRRLIAALAET